MGTYHGGMRELIRVELTKSTPPLSLTPFVRGESVVEHSLSRPLRKSGADVVNTLSFAPLRKGGADEVSRGVDSISLIYTKTNK